MLFRYTTTWREFWPVQESPFLTELGKLYRIKLELGSISTQWENEYPTTNFTFKMNIIMRNVFQQWYLIFNHLEMMKLFRNTFPTRLKIKYQCWNTFRIMIFIFSLKFKETFISFSNTQKNTCVEIVIVKINSVWWQKSYFLKKIHL